MKTLKIVLLSIAALVVIGYFGICFSLSDRILTPEGSNMDRVKQMMVDEWGTSFESLMNDMPAYTPFTIEGYEGVKLSGKYFKQSDSSTCAIIFVHGWGELWAGMLKYVPVINDCSCDYIFYDHRVHGDSEGSYATAGIKESKDLLLVTQWVEQKGFERQNIAWFGSSWGAATSIIAGASNEDVGLIIADAPYQDWYSAIFERAVKDYGNPIKIMSWGIMNIVNLRAGVNYRDASPQNAMKKVEEPVFLFHSRGDTSTYFQQSVNIAQNLNDRSVFHLTEWGNVHVMDVINNREDIRTLLTDYISKEAPQFIAKQDSISTLPEAGVL